MRPEGIRTVVVEVETTLSAAELQTKMQAVAGVRDVVEYENPLADLLYFIGIQLWKLEKRDDFELAELRREIGEAIGEDFRRFPKSWD